MSTNAAARELGYRLTSDSDAPLEKRWISIPQNVWHQPVISKETDWVVVSFHTVPAEELIEERPESRGTGADETDAIPGMTAASR